LPGGAQSDAPSNLHAQAEQLFTLANQSRVEQGAAPLKWDPALASAAIAHCQRMAHEGEIAHRYGGEADLGERAGKAGARFSVIEENVALGSKISSIHEGWMNSPGHRSNLLNPSVNRVGIGVVFSGGVYYAVADYARATEAMTPAQIEAAIGGLIHASGVMIRQDPAIARDTCLLDHGMPSAATDAPPEFVMRWQNGDLTQLPTELKEKLATGRYSQAGVGSCPAKNVEGSFTVYRVAVLLYSAGGTSPKPYY
jgi:hypothetical protein